MPYTPLASGIQLDGLQSLIATMAAITLFIHGLNGFSKELRTVGGEALTRWLKRVTSNRWSGFACGALSTAVVQSSSAVSSLTTALVDASVITFRASIGVILGANVGSTATAWLVSFKLTGIGPFCIVLGALFSALPLRIKIAGKAVFYFGLILFALDLISAELKPLSQQPLFVEWLAMAQMPWLGIATGLLFTAVVQSSSVTTGVAILLAQQGVMPAEAAIPIVIGANVGSTSTALLASLSMGQTARATAMANLIFNLVGVILFFPFIRLFSESMVQMTGNAGMAVAWAHLIFNLTTSMLFLVSLNWTEPRMRRLLLRPKA